MHNGNSKVVGQVTATDKDQDENNSVYGQIKYEFVNQTSKWITWTFCGGRYSSCLIYTISSETVSYHVAAKLYMLW